MDGISRRRLLVGAGMGATALAGAALTGSEARAQDKKPPDAMEVLDKLVGGKKAKEGKVKVRMPEIAENGNTVPLTVAVDSPMTAQDYVKTVHVVADGNPNHEVVSIHFTPLAGKAELSTRMRLARTQSVIAYAEMSDGSVWSGKAEAKVTIGGCGG
ncbi:MAG: thiosulfate oxidation carrier protein SoxY [Rhodospirillales bacterium]|nr:thiosulfate oxidation carrier protein SoxY [Rhodospirillales bacterium]